MDSSDHWSKTVLEAMRVAGDTDITLVARRNTDKEADQDDDPSGPNAMVKIDANRNVLRAASPYYATQLAEEKDENGQLKAVWPEAAGREVVIRDVDPVLFNLAIKFIYGGNSVANELDYESVLELINLAERLQINGLKFLCAHRLISFQKS